MDKRVALLKEIQDALQKNDTATATAKNDEFIKGMSPKLALAVIRKANLTAFSELMKKGEPFRSTAINTAALASEATFSELADPEAIRATVRDMLGEDQVKSFTASRTLKENVGEFGVQYLLDAWVSATGSKQRTQIQIALTEMGTRAVPPLIAALDTKDIPLKGTLISILGSLKDWRAAADLREIADDANLSNEMRDAAMRACAGIVSESAGLDAAKVSASDLYSMLAEDYLANRSSGKRAVISRIYLGEGARFFTWSLQNGAVAYTPVPRFAYNCEMAIENAARALTLNAKSQQAANIIVCARMAEVAAGRMILDYDAALDKDKKVLGEPERKMITDTLTKAQAKAPAAMALGLRALCGGLDLALNNRLDQAAIGCLNAIASIPEARTAQFLPQKPENQETAYGYPIVKAMWSGTRQVKYTAAITLASISSAKPFAQKDMVPELLLKAMEEAATLHILVVHPDVNARNALSLSLKSLGYDVDTAQDSAEGLARAMDFPGPDLVIAFNELDHTTGSFVSTLRDNPATKLIPILIVSTAQALNTDRIRFTFDNVKGLITDVNDKEALGKAVSAFKSVGTWQAKENEAILQQVASIIASLQPTDSVIDLTPYTARLLAIVQSDKALLARTSAMTALGNWRVEKALAPAGVVLAEANAPKDLRVSAALAIASILSSGKVTAVSEETLGILLAALNGPDAEVRSAAAVALASAPLTPEQRARIPER